MKYRYFSDCHLHSDCSCDAEDPIMMMCEAIQRQGPYAVALTDHCECNEYYKEEYDRSTCQSYFEAEKAAAVFQGRLRVHVGVRLGQPLQNVKAAQDVLTTCGLDFILASLHNLAEMEDSYFLDCDHQDVNELLTRYLDEILEMVCQDGFDPLAHLTYPYRYITGDKGISAQLYPDHGEVIDEILSLLVQNHKALELNIFGLRQKLGQTLPPPDVVRRFRQMGGKYVTIGPDAHRWGDIDAGVGTGLSLLLQAGSDRFTICVGHEPVLPPIEQTAQGQSRELFRKFKKGL